MNKSEKIQWRVPFSVHRVNAKADIIKVFHPMAIARILVVSLCIYGAAAYTLPRKIPEIEFDWMFGWYLCFAFAALVIGHCSLDAFIPPMITLTSKGITVTAGQSVSFYEYEKIAELSIAEYEDKLPELVFSTNPHKKQRRYTISKKIDVNRLKSLINTHNKPRQ